MDVFRRNIVFTHTKCPRQTDRYYMMKMDQNLRPPHSLQPIPLGWYAYWRSHSRVWMNINATAIVFFSLLWSWAWNIIRKPANNGQFLKTDTLNDHIGWLGLAGYIFSPYHVNLAPWLHSMQNDYSSKPWTELTHSIPMISLHHTHLDAIDSVFRSRKESQTGVE